MRVIDSAMARVDPADPETARRVAAVDRNFLEESVRCLSFPRHYVAEGENNRRACVWVAESLRSYGYEVSVGGPLRNVVAVHPLVPEGPRMLIGSHYDTVPGTPGADDNASAVAVSLACARALAGFPRAAPVVFVVFNREEDNLLGSTGFLEEYLRVRTPPIAVAHVLEMVGFRSTRPGSQRLPAGFPVKAPDVGDFLALLGNHTSKGLIEPLISEAKTYCPGLHALGLQVYLGLEKHFPPLMRSDHAPFWRAGIPALMWTDTAEFRNRNYHTATDTPDTLDCAFMEETARLLLATILRFGRSTIGGAS